MTKLGQRLSLLVVGAAIALGALGLVLHAHRVSAQELPPPSKMTMEHAIKLDRDLSHLGALAEAKKKIEAEMKTYSDEATDVLAIYKINPNDLGNTVGVDFKTGEITRQPAKVAQAGPPKSPAPSK